MVTAAPDTTGARLWIPRARQAPGEPPCGGDWKIRKTELGFKAPRKIFRRPRLLANGFRSATSSPGDLEAET
jgi:hypothetical protein